MRYSLLLVNYMRSTLRLHVHRSRGVVASFASSPSFSFFSSSGVSVKNSSRNCSTSTCSSSSNRGKLSVERRQSRRSILSKIDDLVEAVAIDISEKEINSTSSSSSSSSSSMNISKVVEALHHLMSLSDPTISEEFISEHLLDSKHSLKGKVLTLAIQALGTSTSSLQLLMKLMTNARDEDPVSLEDIHITAFLKAMRSGHKVHLSLKEVKEVLEFVKSILHSDNNA